jgi:hypothetical protein
MAHVFQILQQDCFALGTRLFTITTHDLTHGLFRRVHTSHPLEYPIHGTKPLDRDAWYDHCITHAQPFIANTPADFATVFFDHALITSLGLGSAANLPILAADGTVPGTVNLLADQGHFTPQKLAAYGTLVARQRPEMLADPAFCLQLSHRGWPLRSSSVQEPIPDGA